jgi:hypothetical protein
MTVDRLIEIFQQIQKSGRGQDIVEAFDPDEEKYYPITNLTYGGDYGKVQLHTDDLESYLLIEGRDPIKSTT